MIMQKSELLSVDDAIVLFLRKKSAATINEIADKVGISRRTVLRKMKELQESEKIGYATLFVGDTLNSSTSHLYTLCVFIFNIQHMRIQRLD